MRVFTMRSHVVRSSFLRVLVGSMCIALIFALAPTALAQVTAPNPDDIPGPGVGEPFAGCYISNSFAGSEASSFDWEGPGLKYLYTDIGAEIECKFKTWISISAHAYPCSGDGCTYASQSFSCTSCKTLRGWAAAYAGPLYAGTCYDTMAHIEINHGGETTEFTRRWCK